MPHAVPWIKLRLLLAETLEKCANVFCQQLREKGKENDSTLIDVVLGFQAIAKISLVPGIQDHRQRRDRRRLHIAVYDEVPAVLGRVIGK